jgi:hypothetical protein
MVSNISETVCLHHAEQHCCHIYIHSCSFNVDSGLAVTAIMQINTNDRCVTQHINPDDADMTPSPTHSVISPSCRWLIRKALLYNCCKIYKSRTSSSQQKPQALQLCELMLILINLYLRITKWNFHDKCHVQECLWHQQDGK